MSVYYLRPNIDSWDTQLNPFIATILAYDDNNKRISGKQLYIVYDITYDDSVPDINNGTTLYSDKDGRIELHFDKQCRISIDLYMVPVFNTYLDLNQMADNYICHHVCSNLFIPLKPYIKSFKAEYTGDSLEITDSIPRKYINVTLEMSDNTLEIINLGKENTEDFIVSPDTINSLQNIITISYYDNLLKKTWTSEVQIDGKEKELEITAFYRGDTRKLGETVYKTDIVITLHTFDGIEEKTKIIPQDEWNFTVPNIITNKNLGVFEIGRGSLRTSVKVPFIWEPSKWRLEAWYEGYNIIVGEKFNLEDLRIWLWEKEGIRKLLDYRDCEIEPNDLTINKEGINWFTVSYTIESWTIKDKFAIIGYKEKQLPQKDFKMLYYNPNIQSLKDVTPYFIDCCSIVGQIYINLERILNRVIELQQYGKFVLYAPPFCGLSTCFSTKWIVSCYYRKAIKAELEAIYSKEEEEDGQT